MFRQKFEQTATLSLPTKSNILAYHVMRHWKMRMTRRRKRNYFVLH